MLSSIGAIDSLKKAYGAYSGNQALTVQTKVQLEGLGIDTSNIKTESQGQITLQSMQGGNSTQEVGQAKQAQGSAAGGGSSELDSLKDEAIALAEKVGVSVSSDDDIDDIMDAISDAITQLQTEAANDPDKIAQVQEYQAEYDTLCQSVSFAQASSEASLIQSSSLQTSLNAMASYNKASISISNS